MKLGYVGRAALAAVYFLALGQESLFSQANTPSIKPSQNLERRITSQQPLHSRLLKTITQLEEEQLVNASVGEDVCEKIGFLIYDDLSALASRYNRSVIFDGLCVYTINNEIVVDNRNEPVGPGFKLWYHRLVMHQNDTALEAENLGFEKETTNIRIARNNGKEIVVERPAQVGDYFAHVSGMGSYDFLILYQRVSDINRAFKKLRRAVPEVRTDNAAKWYLSHPVDGIKYWYIQGQLEFIARGLFERYGKGTNFGYTDRFDGYLGGYSNVRASKGMIVVSIDNGYDQERKGFNATSLVVGNRPEARKTITIIRKGQPSEFDEAEILYPIKK